MCAGVSAITVLYVCESGHVVCEACRKTDRGVSSPKCDINNLKSDLKIKKVKGKGEQGKRGSVHRVLHETYNELYAEDFASGDHNHCSKCFYHIPKSNSVNNIEEDKKLLCGRTIFSEEKIHLKNKVTWLKYRNEKLCDGESPGIRFSQNLMKSSISVQRPVTCPLTDCRKMIARDLILQHFYFDHSKIPRITINSQPHQDFLNAASLTENTMCYAIFLFTTEEICASLLHTSDAGILLNGGYKNVSFLLMGVRMACASTETIMKPHGSDSTSITVPLQTENKAIKMQSSKDELNSDNIPEEVDRYGLEGKLINKNNAIMLWICKLGDKDYYYTISVNKADNKLGYSFTGETMSIEDSHDPKVDGEMECLFIQEKSLKKLVNEQNQLQISVNIFS